MSNALIGLLLGAGFAAWVYSKMMKSTGNNTKNALVTAAIAGGVAFLLTFSLLSLIPAN